VEFERFIAYDNEDSPALPGILKLIIIEDIEVEVYTVEKKLLQKGYCFCENLCFCGEVGHEMKGEANDVKYAKQPSFIATTSSESNPVNVGAAFGTIPFY
jgi:hypothetical protein